MNTILNESQRIKEAFDELFNNRTEEEKIWTESRLLMFRFLSIIETKCEELGWTRKELASKVGTSASYITQLFRGDKLVNMITLAKFQKALGIEFDISEVHSYEETVEAYSPVSDGQGFWVYHKFGIADYDSREEIPFLEYDNNAKVA